MTRYAMRAAIEELMDRAHDLACQDVTQVAVIDFGEIRDARQLAFVTKLIEDLEANAPLTDERSPS